MEAVGEVVAMTQRRTHEHDRNATDGVWILKFAILAVSAGLFATFVDQLAAAIILYVAALGAIGIFYRRYMRPAYRKYVRPFKDLPAHMEKMEAGQVAIKEQVEKVAAQVAAVEKTTEGIKVSSEAARELATAAVDVAQAVGRKMGIGARGDGEEQ